MGPIHLLVAGFDHEHRAEHVLDELRVMDRDDDLSILNAIVVRKDASGNVTASQDGDLRAGGGALFGALVGALVGFLGGPGGAVVGAAAGAITGGITAAGMDLGFSEETLEAIQSSLFPNQSVILALVEAEWTEPFEREIYGRNGRIVQAELREEFVRRARKERNKD